VTLFDAHLVPGQPEYLAMEFVDGPTLGARLASGGPLAPDLVAHLAAELAEALHVVHSAGVVHRDIKPSNVLLSPAHLPGARPRAKLADFGIAYLLDTSRITAPGLVIGTVAYLAPEQIRGSDPAPASDIYALGLVLLEALTGRRAHSHGDGLSAALSRLEKPPAIPASLDQGWAELLSRMLALEPSARPTAAEVVAATKSLTASAPRAVVPAGTAATVAVTAPTLVAPAPAAAPAAVVARADRSPGPRRKRMLAILGGTVAAAVAAVGVDWGSRRWARARSRFPSRP
jgi:serine/threonine protein kinase